GNIDCPSPLASNLDRVPAAGNGNGLRSLTHDAAVDGDLLPRCGARHVDDSVVEESGGSGRRWRWWWWWFVRARSRRRRSSTRLGRRSHLGWGRRTYAAARLDDRWWRGC